MSINRGVKMNASKKSQAAMEFLMTYGWALLVVLIAIAAMALFGLLNPTRYLPAKCELGAGINCMSASAFTDNERVSDGDANDKIALLIKNGVGYTMRNISVNITNCDPILGGEVEILPAGETERVEIQCGGMVLGARMQSKTIITYLVTIDSETLSHVKVGHLSVDVGTTP
jgi:hypothetical protein